MYGSDSWRKWTHRCCAAPTPPSSAFSLRISLSRGCKSRRERHGSIAGYTAHLPWCKTTRYKVLEQSRNIHEKRGGLVEDYQAIATRIGTQKGWKLPFFVPPRSSCLLWANDAWLYRHSSARTAPSDIWRTLGLGERGGSKVAEPRPGPK
jgi:hypothetical protein